MIQRSMIDNALVTEMLEYQWKQKGIVLKPLPNQAEVKHIVFRKMFYSY